MKAHSIEKPTNAQLVALGLSRSYASELVNGKKLPSWATASMIERELGFPMNAWHLFVPRPPESPS